MVWPCIVKKVMPNGAVEVQSPSQGNLTVNGQRLKHYLVGENIVEIEEEDLPSQEQVEV
jgi:hypothetical protein